ncbi:MAG TPA: PfkB family carbohydrate kinase [Trueperaceae bacterium]
MTRDGLPLVVCAGLSCVDHIWQVGSFPPAASRTDASGYRLQGGGPAATAAVTVARLGGRAHLWAVHGDDPGGAFVVDELKRLGVETGGVRVVPGATSWVSAVLVAPDGERWIFPYRGAGLPDNAPSERPADAGALLVDFRQPRLCREAIDWAAGRGVPIVGDLGNARYWESSERLDVIIASEECAEEVLGRDDPEAALAAMRWRPDQHVGVTLGAEGYLYDAGQGVRHLPALPVTVVDTTGAGDVFHGAYAFALASGWDADRCAAFASVTAAISCTGVGRSAIPDGATVERLLEERSLGELREGA